MIYTPNDTNLTSFYLFLYMCCCSYCQYTGVCESDMIMPCVLELMLHWLCRTLTCFHESRRYRKKCRCPTWFLSVDTTCNIADHYFQNTLRHLRTNESLKMPQPSAEVNKSFINKAAKNIIFSHFFIISYTECLWLLTCNWNVRRWHKLMCRTS